MLEKMANHSDYRKDFEEMVKHELTKVNDNHTMGIAYGKVLVMDDEVNFFFDNLQMVRNVN